MNEPKTITTPDKAEQRRNQISNSLNQFKSLIQKDQIFLPLLAVQDLGPPKNHKNKIKNKNTKTQKGKHFIFTYIARGKRVFVSVSVSSYDPFMCVVFCCEFLLLSVVLLALSLSLSLS